LNTATTRTKLLLQHTFRTSHSADDFRETILIKIGDGDLEGIGEAAPNPRYGQTPDSAEEALSAIDPELIGSADGLDDAIDKVSRLIGRERASLAAVDIALHDLHCKRLKLPLYGLFGFDPVETPITSYTIAIDTPGGIEKRIAEAKDYKILKVKMGSANDRQMIEMIRKHTDRPIRVDANEGWTREEALEKIQWLEGQNVELVEQPLPEFDLEGIRWLSERVSIPIFADESVRKAGDIPRLAGIYQGVNIKLMKCGGIREAARMIEIAKDFELLVMLGCMIETSVGITAAAHLSPSADYADLDGNLLISNDPATGVVVSKGRLVLPTGPGLGISILDEEVRTDLMIVEDRKPQT